MPRIPSLSRKRRVTPQGPISGSSSGAGIRSNNIRAFSQGFKSFGKGLESAFKAYEDHNEKIETRRAENDLRRADIDARLYAEQNAAEDGSNLNELYQKRFGENTKDLDGRYGGRVGEYVGVLKDTVATNGYEDMVNKSYVRQVKHMDTKVQEDVDETSSRIRLNPELYATEKQAFMEHIDSLPALYTGENGDKAKQAAKRQFAMAAINGQMDKGNYRGAMNQVDTEFADAFDAEEADKLRQRIKGREQSDLQRSVYLDSQREAIDIEKRFSTNERAFNEGLNSVLDPEDNILRSDAFKKAEEQRDSGIIDQLSYEAITQGSLDVPDGPEKSSFMSDIRYRIDNDYPMSSIRASVKRGIASRTISYQEGQKLLGQLDFNRELYRKSPELKKEVKAASAIIKSAVQGPSMLKRSLTSDELKKISAIEGSMGSQLMKGLSVKEATKMALKENGVEVPDKRPDMVNMNRRLSEIHKETSDMKNQNNVNPEKIKALSSEFEDLIFEKKLSEWYYGR